MHRRVGPTTVVLALAAALAACALLEASAHLMRRAYDELMDNRNHYLPCSQLPPAADVLRVMEEQDTAIQAILQVNPGHVGVEVDTATCPGRADLLIWYASHENRLAIERLIAGRTFHGVPYRLQNR